MIVSADANLIVCWKLWPSHCLSTLELNTWTFDDNFDSEIHFWNSQFSRLALEFEVLLLNSHSVWSPFIPKITFVKISICMLVYMEVCLNYWIAVLTFQLIWILTEWYQLLHNFLLRLLKVWNLNFFFFESKAKEINYSQSPKSTNSRKKGLN